MFQHVTYLACARAFGETKPSSQDASSFQKSLLESHRVRLCDLGTDFCLVLVLQRDLFNRSCRIIYTWKDILEKNCQYLSPARNSITALQLPIFQQHFATCTKYEKTSLFSSIEPAVSISQVTQELTLQNKMDSTISQSDVTRSNYAYLNFLPSGAYQSKFYLLTAKSHMHCEHTLHIGIPYKS